MPITFELYKIMIQFGLLIWKMTQKQSVVVTNHSKFKKKERQD